MGGEKRFRLQKLTPLDFLPKDIRALGDQQIGRDQFGFLPEYQRLRRTVLLDHFDGDAGIDEERIHRPSRPSRSRRGISLVAVTRVGSHVVML